MMGNCSSATTHPALQAIDLGNGVRIDTPVILAPMSGVTDLPFRRTAKELGAGMVSGNDRLLGDDPGEPPPGR